jgi:hypothetical protein
MRNVRFFFGVLMIDRSEHPPAISRVNKTVSISSMSCALILVSTSSCHRI